MVWLLPGEAHEPLTFSIEVDATGRLLPGFPAPDRLSTAYRGYFVPICVAPCGINLPRGIYSLGLARRDDLPIPVTTPLVVDRDTTVVAQYRSHRWRRGLGIAVIVAGALAASFLFASAAATSVTCPSDGECGDGGNALAYGVGAFAAGIGTGIVLIATGRDSVTIVQR